MRHSSLFGKTLRAFHTKVDYESVNWLRVMNSGMVIIERIGQPACLLPKDVMLVYGRASETEREWVINEGLSNLRWLKVQSIPLGKPRGIEERHVESISRCNTRCSSRYLSIFHSSN